MSSRVVHLLLLGLLTAGQAVAAEPLRIPLETRSEWIALPVRPGSSTRSALRIERALDPASGRPYDPSNRALGCDPQDLDRRFELDKTGFLLGEPIVVGLRIGLDGPGEYRVTIGGNYRARGRDDNFLFLLRHADGRWVADPYGQVTVYMGGLSSEVGIGRGKPITLYQPLQRWAVLERSGEYDLYCLAAATGYDIVGRRQAIEAGLPARARKRYRIDPDGFPVDRKTGRAPPETALVIDHQPADPAPSPLLAELPPEVAERARDWGIQNLADYAHFRIRVRAPGPAERAAMVAAAIGQADAPGPSRWPPGRRQALRQAMIFARQDDFTAWLATQAARPEKTDPDVFTGLAMRSSPAALKPLLEAATPAATSALSCLAPQAIPEAIPVLIERLTHPDHQIRALAELQLVQWSGTRFDRRWTGYRWDRPTLKEARRMQPRWRAWWEKNSQTFRFPAQCSK